MQHIVVATAKPANLKAPDWTTNGVGRNVSHSFGYGLMDAAAMVRLARNWPTVPEQHKCEVLAPHNEKVIPAKSYVTLELLVKECAGVNYLEHVQAKISLMSQRRGDLEIKLTSPAGTRTTLLARRPHDVSRSGFRSWPFMSVHTWGENPLGVWKLEIHNEARFLAKLSDWNLMFYGTESAPGYELETVTPKKKEDANSDTFNEDNSVEMNSGSRWKEIAQRTGQTSQEVVHTMPEVLSGCQKPANSCLECASGFLLWNGKCEENCPPGTFLSGPRECQLCHYTCLHCEGPYDYHCTSCYGDAELFESNFESYCYPKSLYEAINFTKWYYRTCIILGINVILLVLLPISYHKYITWKNNPEIQKKPLLKGVKYRLTQNDSDSEN